MLDLCAASPALLGKYAWRFPNFASTVTSSEAATGLVDVLLWNLFGIHLSATSGTSSTTCRIQWKNTKAADSTKDAPSAKECQQTAWSAFQDLCQQVRTTLDEWKKELQPRPFSSQLLRGAEHRGQQPFDLFPAAAGDEGDDLPFWLEACALSQLFCTRRERIQWALSLASPRSVTRRAATRCACCATSDRLWPVRDCTWLAPQRYSSWAPSSVV